jgi:hypothetical protein
MTIERDADDVACCYVLEQELYDGGFEQTFAGEVVGLISAGAFVAFGDAAAGPVYEGLLPVRRMGPPAAAPDEWWEINELATVLHGKRTGATVRLGDPIGVRVARVDTSRGRVDLIAAPDDGPGGGGHRASADGHAQRGGRAPRAGGKQGGERAPGGRHPGGGGGAQGARGGRGGGAQGGRRGRGGGTAASRPAGGRGGRSGGTAGGGGRGGRAPRG